MMIACAAHGMIRDRGRRCYRRRGNDWRGRRRNRWLCNGHRRGSLSSRLWRSDCRWHWLGRGRSRRNRHGRGSWTASHAQTPESGCGLGELQLHVAAGIISTGGLGFQNRTDHFLFRFFVGQENELPGSQGGIDANYRALRKNQNCLCGLGERLSLVRTRQGASAVDGYRNLESNRLRASGLFSGRLRGGFRRSGRCDGSFCFFQRSHVKLPTLEGKCAGEFPAEGQPALLLHGGVGERGQL
jgi:hypothetical protein